MDHLIRHADKMRKGFKALGFNIESKTAIVPVVIGDDTKTFIFWRELLESASLSIFRQPPRPPGMAMLAPAHGNAKTGIWSILSCLPSSGRSWASSIAITRPYTVPHTAPLSPPSAIPFFRCIT
jgi:hypothetical protein